jgi:hypothetical protein
VWCCCPFFEKQINMNKEQLKEKFKILAYFKYEHLPFRLQKISKPFSDVAHKVATNHLGHESDGNNADISETITSLRKLLEAKDCAVRAVGNFK